MEKDDETRPTWWWQEDFSRTKENAGEWKPERKFGQGAECRDGLGGPIRYEEEHGTPTSEEAGKEVDDEEGGDGSSKRQKTE